MYSITPLVAIAALVAAVPSSVTEQELTPERIDYPDGIDNHTIAARADHAGPGVYMCQRTDFKGPCAWFPVAQDGALTCRRIDYTQGARFPDISFGPDKGTTCKVYGGTNCEPIEPILMIDNPGGNILKMGYDNGKFPTSEDGKADIYPGFYSYRCRGWNQKEPNDKEQTRFIPLPKKP